MWHLPSTAPVARWDSTPIRNLNACCSTCATKTVAVFPTCADPELLSTSNTASVTGFTTLTAKKPTNGDLKFKPKWEIIFIFNWRSIFVPSKVLPERVDLRHGCPQAREERLRIGTNSIRKDWRKNGPFCSSEHLCKHISSSLPVSRFHSFTIFFKPTCVRSSLSPPFIILNALLYISVPQRGSSLVTVKRLGHRECLTPATLIRLDPNSFFIVKQKKKVDLGWPVIPHSFDRLQRQPHLLHLLSYYFLFYPFTSYQIRVLLPCAGATNL